MSHGRLVLSLVVSLVALGCGNGRTGAPKLKQNIGLDLSKVQGFVLGQPSATSSSGLQSSGVDSTQPTVLYAATTDGTFTETRMTDDGSGNTTTSQTHENAAAIFNTPKYALFSFRDLKIASSDGHGTVPCPVVALRKSDGALFCSDGINLQDQSVVVATEDGSMGYATRPGALYRVSFSDTDAPTFTTLVDASGPIEVNSVGDALMQFRELNGVQSTTRVFKSNGGLQNVSTANVACITRGLTGEPNDFYFLEPPGAGANPVVPLKRVAHNAAGGYDVTEVGSISGQDGYAACSTALRTSASVLVTRGTQPVIVELVNGAFDFAVHPVAGISTLLSATGAGNFIYVQGTDSSGNGAIVRLDVTDWSSTTVLPPGDFSLSAISLSSTGELSFSGLRNADGKHVLGVIQPGATTYTIQSESAPVVTAMARIN